MLLSLNCQAKTIRLNQNNHYFLDTGVNIFSVAIATAELQRLDKVLPDNQVLYLVLKTPGGAVIAGMDFIRAMSQLRHKVATISIHAMSMGFQFVQALPGPRYVVDTGILMTHPISGTCEGRVEDVESCLRFMRALALPLDVVSAARMKLSLDSYRKKAATEWWAIGQGAVDLNMADEVVDIKCDADMNSKDRCPY